MPAEWEARIKDAGLDKKTCIENSDALLDVLKFQDQFAANKGNDATANPAQPSNAEAPLPETNAPLSLRDLVGNASNRDLYKNAKKIGEGAAGEVFLATNSKTGLSVAIKKMPITAENIKLLCTEIDIMKDSKHPNIVEYIDSFIVDDNQLWVVMEYMDGGCLTDVLEQFDEIKLNEGQISYICHEVSLHFTGKADQRH
mgnify:CR=1 FL=1